MTRRGHVLAGAAAVIPLYLTGVIASPYVVAASFVSFNVPDTMETGFVGGRRLIPHRTLTHWWPLWAMLLQGAAWMPGIAHWVAQGVAIGALVHIAVDAFSPCGVPVLLPAAAYRRSVAIFYRTGDTMGEAAMILTVAAVALLYGLARQAPLAKMLSDLFAEAL